MKHIDFVGISEENYIVWTIAKYSYTFINI